MTFDSDGEIEPRDINEILADIEAALNSEFVNPNLGPGGTPGAILRGFGGLPIDQQEQDIAQLSRNMYPSTAAPPFLRKHLEDWVGFEKQVAKVATGTVHLPLDAVKTTSDFDPMFEIGDLAFVDESGERYLLNASVAPMSKQTEITETGTSSEEINSSRTKIAQKFTLDEKTFIQAFAVQVTHVSGTPTFDVRVVGDDNDQPDGILQDARLEENGFQPSDGSDDDQVFTDGGAVLEAGTYWLVFDRTDGKATFDGGTGGTADQVQVNDGSWGLSSNVENLNIDIWQGVTASVQAESKGADGNIDAENITGRELLTSQGTTRWTSHVDDGDATNLEAFTGGQDEETPGAYYRRFKESRAASPDVTEAGIASALTNADIGVTGADVVENTDVDAGQQNTVFKHEDETGSSTTIDGTTTELAQRFTLENRRFLQYVKAQLVTDTSLVVDVRIEKHDGANNEPNGTLAHSRLEKVDYDFGGIDEETITFDEGAYLDPGTYWIVFVRKSGSGDFEGGPISNAVANPGFETYSSSPGAPDDWVKFGGASTVRKETTNVDVGSNAAEVEATDSGAEDRGIQQNLSLEQGIEYTFQARARTDGNAGEVPALWVRDVTNGVDVAEVTGTDGGATYETLSVDVVAEEGITYAIRLGHRAEDVNNGDVVYFDEVDVQNADTVHKEFAGSWSSGSVQGLDTSVIGGVPPHNFRVFVDGSFADDDVAKVIYGHRSLGLGADGKDKGTVSIPGGTKDQRFEEVLPDPLVMSITVVKDPDLFTGDEDTIRDALVNYVDGLGINEEFRHFKAIGRITNNDALQGVVDVTEFLHDLKENDPLPQDLDSGDTSNQTPDSGSTFLVTDPDIDIEVTLQDV